MNNKEPWYIGLRSEALSVVYLTRRDDLIVSKDKQNQGLDILVSITKNTKNVDSIDKYFGVIVRGTQSSANPIQDDEICNVDSKELISIAKKFNFPICLFFFTLDKDNDHGYYKWILAPIIDRQNRKKLNLNPNLKFRKLTKQAINDIVFLVNQWYANQPNSYIINDITSQIPQTEWEKLPSDMSKNLD
ncbi:MULTISPECIES: DUF4365 domain-containing protein [unclassified Anabaena]|uniref:DUF4365 domain-containing protein n=1 Tax=unclassified Anabaena TaxID=2619674 RepID=UPI001445CF4E|nr:MULTISPECIES: DUF4365 domain-containing protein [unclassified Anabaena]MTJ07549.1 DUF4365 domain-containing protein [Anabaena sp. UHCC 0204]MTJ52622.1 DUF4365 domain-containing protein [Anabaena sp. UHCC 0253]